MTEVLKGLPRYDCIHPGGMYRPADQEDGEFIKFSDVEKALGGWVPEPRTKANIEERLAVLARCAVEYDCAQPDAGAVALFWRFYDLFPALFCEAGIFCGDDGSIEVVVTDDPARVEMIFSKHPLPSPPKETA